MICPAQENVDMQRLHDVHKNNDTWTVHKTNYGKSTYLMRGSCLFHPLALLLAAWAACMEVGLRCAFISVHV